MRIFCDRQALADAVNNVQRAVASKSALPALEGILLKASASSLFLAGYDMELGITLLTGKGAFTGDEKKVALCAFKRSLIVPIKAAVTEIDPAAFIIVCEAHEVLGEGFGEYSPDNL